MAGCPFATMWAAKGAGSAMPATTIEASDLRHSHSGVHLSSQAEGLEALSLSRAISTPRLESQTTPASTASSINSTPPAPAQGNSSSVATQRLTRRQLRKLGKVWSLAEVRQHARKDDAWIAVDGKVYDITEHLLNHPGWENSSAISTALSILAHAGTECSEEFREIHRPYPVAWRQLQAYYIGDLAPQETDRSAQ